MSVNDTPVGFYIVVADDDLQDHELVKDALKQCSLNHIVTSVYNGGQLLNLLNKEGFYVNEFKSLPDLIILDLNMPILGGMEALKKIKTDPKFKTIPVCVLTSSQDREQSLIARENGAFEYFEKPSDFKELVKLIKSMCETVAQKKLEHNL